MYTSQLTTLSARQFVQGYGRKDKTSAEASSLSLKSCISGRLQTMVHWEAVGGNANISAGSKWICILW